MKFHALEITNANILIFLHRFRKNCEYINMKKKIVQFFYQVDKKA